MILDELSTYVAANSTLAVGTDLFMHSFPATAGDTAVAFFETGGVTPSVLFSGVDHERPTVQVVVRSDAYPTARSLAQVVFNLFTSIENVTLPTSSGVAYISGTAQQQPFSIGDDGKGRPQVSCNYLFEKEVSST